MTRADKKRKKGSSSEAMITIRGSKARKGHKASVDLYQRVHAELHAQIYIRQTLKVVVVGEEGKFTTANETVPTIPSLPVKHTR